MGYKTGRYQSWGKTSKAFSYALREAGYAANSMTLLKMTVLADDYLKETDSKWPHSTSGKNGSLFGGDREHPWYSGQLHDSIAVRIAQGNRISAVRFMPQRATMPPGEPGRFLDASGAQSMTGVSDNIVGAEWAVTAAENAGRYSHFFSPGIQVQLIAGVPYANKVNEGFTGKRGGTYGRHLGFFDSLADDLVVKYDTFDWNKYFNEQTIVADVTGGTVVVKRRGIRKR